MYLKLQLWMKKTVHLLAMRAMETFAYYLKSLESNLFLTNQIKNFHRKKINVWLLVKKYQRS